MSLFSFGGIFWFSFLLYTAIPYLLTVSYQKIGVRHAFAFSILYICSPSPSRLVDHHVFEPGLLCVCVITCFMLLMSLTFLRRLRFLMYIFYFIFLVYREVI